MIDSAFHDPENYSSVPQRIWRVVLYVLEIGAGEHEVSAW